jgi:hypothetical protein
MNEGAARFAEYADHVLYFPHRCGKLNNAAVAIRFVYATVQTKKNPAKNAAT